MRGRIGLITVLGIAAVGAVVATVALATPPSPPPIITARDRSGRARPAAQREHKARQRRTRQDQDERSGRDHHPEDRRAARGHVWMAQPSRRERQRGRARHADALPRRALHEMGIDYPAGAAFPTHPDEVSLADLGSTDVIFFATYFAPKTNPPEHRFGSTSHFRQKAAHGQTRRGEGAGPSGASSLYRPRGLQPLGEQFRCRVRRVERGDHLAHDRAPVGLEVDAEAAQLRVVDGEALDVARARRRILDPLALPVSARTKSATSWMLTLTPDAQLKSSCRICSEVAASIVASHDVVDRGERTGLRARAVDRQRPPSRQRRAKIGTTPPLSSEAS